MTGEAGVLGEMETALFSVGKEGWYPGGKGQPRGQEQAWDQQKKRGLIQKTPLQQLL